MSNFKDYLTKEELITLMNSCTSFESFAYCIEHGYVYIITTPDDKCDLIGGWFLNFDGRLMYYDARQHRWEPSFTDSIGVLYNERWSNYSTSVKKYLVISKYISNGVIRKSVRYVKS